MSDPSTKGIDPIDVAIVMWRLSEVYRELGDEVPDGVAITSCETIDELRKAFGPKVVDLVLGVTHQMRRQRLARSLAMQATVQAMRSSGGLH